MLESGVIKMVERDEQGRVVSEIFYDEISIRIFVVWTQMGV